MITMKKVGAEQSKHDLHIYRWASFLDCKGWFVKADICGWNKPPVINGYRPDILAKKESKKKLIEVETKNTKNSLHALSQERAFIRWEKSSSDREFLREII